MKTGYEELIRRTSNLSVKDIIFNVLLKIDIFASLKEELLNKGHSEILESPRSKILFSVFQMLLMRMNLSFAKLDEGRRAFTLISVPKFIVVEMT